jgi:hypothetical protein
MDYFVDDLVKASERGALGAGSSDPVVRSNRAPVLALEGKTEVQAEVGKPVTIVATATDDGIPAPKVRQAVAFFFATSDGSLPIKGQKPQWQPPLQVTVDSATGLWVSCFPYRGGGEVTFEPDQVKPWEDSRTGANSPWSPTWTAPPPPADNRWVSQVSFAEPGEYVVRCQANDGALTTERDVKVVVTQP